MFNNYFNDYMGFTFIIEGKVLTKFTMPDIKLYETENPHYHVRNSLCAMTLKGINKDMFHIIFP